MGVGGGRPSGRDALALAAALGVALGVAPVEPRAASAAGRASISGHAWWWYRATLRRLEKAGAGLFDGSVYSGATAVDVGLADRVGELKSELQRRYGRYVQLEVIEPARPVDLNRLMRWLM